MTAFLTALGLAVAIEGVLYALFPAQMKRMIASVLMLPEDKIRLIGLFMAVLGVVVVWLIKG